MMKLTKRGYRRRGGASFCDHRPQDTHPGQVGGVGVDQFTSSVDCELLAPAPT